VFNNKISTTFIPVFETFESPAERWAHLGEWVSNTLVTHGFDRHFRQQMCFDDLLQKLHNSSVHRWQGHSNDILNVLFETVWVHMAEMLLWGKQYVRDSTNLLGRST
jgi:hypothetical protein